MASFDDLGHDDGFVLFTTTLDGSSAPVRLVVGEEVRDRAWVLLDGVPVGVLARDHHERALTLPSGRGELAILVENQGRVNYGTRIGEHKGLIGGVTLDGAPLTGWAARALALECLPTWPSRHRRSRPGRSSPPARSTSTSRPTCTWTRCTGAKAWSG